MHICNSASSVFIRSRSSQDENIASFSFWYHEGTEIHLPTFDLQHHKNKRSANVLFQTAAQQRCQAQKYITFVQKSAL